MHKTALSLALLFSLTGCNILFPEDPRVGAEDADDCTERVAGLLTVKLATAEGGGDALWVPTFTYDVTKLSLEAIQDLSAGGDDQTQGTRLTQSTNETQTARDQFMEQSVDENGVFFLGHDPALFRVRGEPTRFDNMIAAGCERQQVNMRLIDVDFLPAGASKEATETEITEGP